MRTTLYSYLRLGSKNLSKDINNYYLLNKSVIKRYGVTGITMISAYFLNKKFQFIQKFKKNYVIDPLMEIFNSKEVKGSGVNLIEDLFKDKRVLKTILISLKQSIKEKEFEEPLKVFIKHWVLKVLKHPEFLHSTKRSVIEMLKSKDVTDETAILLKYLAETQEIRQSVAEFFKILALCDEVFPQLCDLFEKSALNAIKSQKNKTKAASFLSEMYSDKQFRYFMYSKILAFSK